MNLSMLKLMPQINEDLFDKKLVYSKMLTDRAAEFCS